MKEVFLQQGNLFTKNGTKSIWCVKGEKAMNKSYGNLIELFEDIFNDSFKILRGCDVQPIRYNKQISSGSFPPTNIYIDKDTKEMTVQAALAGIREDQISLSWDGDYLKLVVNATEEKDEKPRVFIQTGLKKIKEFETSWAVDPRFYSRDDFEVTFENGLLTVVIRPKEDVKPRKLTIFGGLNLITDETRDEESKDKETKD